MKNSEYVLTAKMLSELDELYEGKKDPGSRVHDTSGWRILVEELRRIRRLVEAGTRVRIGETDQVLSSWQGFYTWAHGRYYLLEEGSDSWIGDDS